MGRTVDNIAVVLILGGLTAWVIWGYASWRRSDVHFSAAERCSLAGFTLASLSAVFEIGSALVAQFHHFHFYDSALMKIYACGFLTAALGLVVSVGGLARKSPLRWKAPALSTVMLLLWLCQVASE
jgi:hypothetical protein